jgi:hypothetical protein
MSIIIKENVNGEKSYRVRINFKNIEISKTFYDERDAKLFIKYKKRLLCNMENFEVNINQRVTIQDIFELKKRKIPISDKKSLSDLHVALERFQNNLPDKFLSQLTYEDWLECTKKLSQLDIYRGAKTEAGKRIISFKTLKKTLAIASSCVSNAIEEGIHIENFPLKVIQTFLIKLLKTKESAQGDHY